jgi:hypothetical protein
MGGYPLGYPDIRQDFRGKGTSASAFASAGGYPPADSGYPETISNNQSSLQLPKTSPSAASAAPPSGTTTNNSIPTDKPIIWLICSLLTLILKQLIKTLQPASSSSPAQQLKSSSPSTTEQQQFQPTLGSYISVTFFWIFNLVQVENVKPIIFLAMEV